jgi:hypothetical protein
MCITPKSEPPKKVNISQKWTTQKSDYLPKVNHLEMCITPKSEPPKKVIISQKWTTYKCA